MLTGPGGFDGSIESEEIGLAGDVVDGLDDGADLVRAVAHLAHLGGGNSDFGFDGVHVFDGLRHGLGADLRRLRRLRGVVGDDLGIAGHLLDSGTEPFGDGRHLPDGCGLVLGAAGDAVDGTLHLLHATGRLSDARGLLGGAAGDLLDRRGDLVGGFTGLGRGRSELRRRSGQGRGVVGQLPGHAA